MGQIKLDGYDDCSSTIISNQFIDKYMPSANGEFVKIYLYLLRSLSSPDRDISVCNIADIFNHTEKDVIRALKYWEQLGLLDLSFDNSKLLTGIHFKPISNDYITSDGTSIEASPNISSRGATLKHFYNEASVSKLSNKQAMPAESDYAEESTIPAAKKTYTANELDALKSNDEVKEFLYPAQKYIGMPLSHSDVNILMYIYDQLNFKPELIEYLVEYCIDNGHKSVRYMEKVALSWAASGINSLQKAKEQVSFNNKNCYPVLKAFGITGRNPAKGERDLITKWTTSYGFNIDIIVDACNRTMNAIHQPSFEYADTILSKWKDRGIKSMTDIKLLDEEHNKNKALHPPKNTFTNNTTASAVNNKSTKSKNSFNDFSQRTYNYETLEKELLGNI